MSQLPPFLTIKDSSHRLEKYLFDMLSTLWRWWNDHDNGTQAFTSPSVNALSMSGDIDMNGNDIVDLASINSTFIGLGRNRLINGDMRIDQINAGAAATSNSGAAAQTLDGITNGSVTVSGAVLTYQRSTATPPTGFTHFLRITCTTADASIGAGDAVFFDRNIEGYFVDDMLFGTANAKTITLSFWVRSSLTGTYSGAFQNSAQNRSYPFEYTINAANTWEQKTVTLTGDLTGTWVAATGIGLRLRMALALGSDFTGTANAWNGNLDLGTANQVNFVSSSTSRTYDITGMQLEIGSVATAFEYRPISTEVLYCQRYYRKSYAIDTAIGTNTSASRIQMTLGQTGATTMYTGTLFFGEYMRGVPTITLYAQDGTSGNWNFVSTGGVDTERAASAINVFTNGFMIQQTVAVEYWGYGHYTADARI